MLVEAEERGRSILMGQVAVLVGSEWAKVALGNWVFFVMGYYFLRDCLLMHGVDCNTFVLRSVW